MATRSASAILRRLRPLARQARLAPLAARQLHHLAARSVLLSTPRPCLPTSSQTRSQSTHQVASLTPDEYDRLSDSAMDNLLESLEEAIDNGVGKSAEEEWEVVYSSGVMTLSCGPHGTYVLNKQPPNQQIWLSSPLSGPKRYDFSTSAASSSGDAADRGVWVYHRDGSTLRELLERELTEFAGERVEVWVERRGTEEQ